MDATNKAVPRYDLVETQRDYGYMATWDKALELDPDGEWCKYADVAAMLTPSQPAAASAPSDLPPLPVPWITDGNKGVQPEARNHYAEDQMIDYVLADRAARAAAPVGQQTIRKAYICKSCDCVYADQTVTQCDCMPDKQEYIEGTINYPSAAPVSGQGAITDEEIENIMLPLMDKEGRVKMMKFAQAIDSRPRSEDSRVKVLEEAAKACENKRVGNTGTEGDIGYNQAIRHAAAAIRALASTPPKADNE